MKRFRFNLQALLELKRRKEDDRKRQLAEVNGRLVEAQRILKEIEQEWLGLQEEELSRRKTGTSAAAMGWAVNYRLFLQEKAIKQDLSIQRILAEQEAKRKALVKATQEKKALENLRDRRMEEWRKAYRREETKTIDDFSQIQYARRRLASL